MLSVLSLTVNYNFIRRESAGLEHEYIPNNQIKFPELLRYFCKYFTELNLLNYLNRNSKKYDIPSEERSIFPTLDEKMIKIAKEKQDYVKSIVKRLYNLPKNAKTLANNTIKKVKCFAESDSNPTQTLKDSNLKIGFNGLKRYLSCDFPTIKMNSTRTSANFLNRQEFLEASARVKDYFLQKEELRNMIRNGSNFC